MKRLASLFRNPQERRLRAFWRVLIQALLWFVLGIVLNVFYFALQGPAALEDPLAAATSLVPALLSLLAALLATLIAGKFLDQRSFAGFGFHFDRAWWVDFAFGLALGATLIGFIFLIELALGWVEITGRFVSLTGGMPLALALSGGFLTVLFAASGEEILFRGYQLENLAEGLNLRQWGPALAVGLATLLSSVAFGLAHLLNPNATLFSTFNIAVAGVFLALGRIFLGQLAIPIGAHVAWNFTQWYVFGFTVSGIPPSGGTLIAVEQGGPALWTGGAFGPEAGLLGFLALVLGSLLTLPWIKLRRGDLRLDPSLPEPPSGVQGESADRNG